MSKYTVDLNKPKDEEGNCEPDGLTTPDALIPALWWAAFVILACIIMAIVAVWKG